MTRADQEFKGWLGGGGERRSRRRKKHPNFANFIFEAKWILAIHSTAFIGFLGQFKVFGNQNLCLHYSYKHRNMIEAFLLC